MSTACQRLTDSGQDLSIVGNLATMFNQVLNFKVAKASALDLVARSNSLIGCKEI